MSTRGMVGCLQGGVLRGTYNHFDSYPSGLGADVVAVCKMFAADNHMYDNFKAKWAAVTWIEDDQDLPTVKQAERIREAGFELKTPDLDELQAMGTNRDTEQNWYWLTHHYQGARMFLAVLDGWPYLIESSGFMRDSLFCEYAYVLDLDRDVLEFYRGFQKVYGHLTQYPGYYYAEASWRMGNTPIKDGYKYGPCRKVGERRIDDLDGWQIFYPKKEDDDD